MLIQTLKNMWTYFLQKKTLSLKKVDSRGFTLIETVLALGVFMLLTFTTVNILSYASSASSKLIIKSELLENARIGMDVLVAHIQEAESVSFRTDPGSDTLAELVATVKKNAGYHEYKFTYNKSLGPLNARYHRLDFGGNELASYVNDIQIKKSGSVLSIKIITDRGLAYNQSVVESIVLTVKLDLKYKN